MTPDDSKETADKLDGRIVQELKDLLEFAPAHKIRRSLTDLFFHCMLTSDPDSYRGLSYLTRRSCSCTFTT